MNSTVFDYPSYQYT